MCQWNENPLTFLELVPLIATRVYEAIHVNILIGLKTHDHSDHKMLAKIIAITVSTSINTWNAVNVLFNIYILRCTVKFVIEYNSTY